METSLSRRLLKRFFLFLLFSIFGPNVFAETTYLFNCEQAQIKGLVQYSVVGKYNAVFKECSGTLTYDHTRQMIKSVKVKVKVQSIHSDCDWCDKVVVSKKLLDAGSYPWIIFESDHFKKSPKGYTVAGKMDLHGVVKDLESPFSFEEVIIHGKKYLRAKGVWVIPRKDYGIVWSEHLDKGGVIVGNHVTVDWEILATES